MSKKHVTAAITAAALVGAPVLGISAATLAGAWSAPSDEGAQILLAAADAAPADEQTAEAASRASVPAAQQAPVVPAPVAPAPVAPAPAAPAAPAPAAPAPAAPAAPAVEVEPAQDVVTPDVTKPVIRDAAFGPVRGVQTFALAQDEENPARAYVEIQQIADGKWKKLAGREFLDTNAFPFTVDTDLLASGVRTQLKVSSWDDAGNHTSKTFPVAIDRDRPTVALVAPIASSVNAAPLEIQVDAADANGLDRVTANIYRDGALVKSTSLRAEGAATASHRASVTLGDGDYVIRYNASDLAGNISTTTQFPVSIDTVAPSISVKPGTTTVNDIYRTKPSFALSDAGTGKVDYVVINGVKKDLTNNKWSDLNAQNYTAKQGANLVEVFDTAGNSASFSFVYDSLAPEIRVKAGAVVVQDTFLNVPSFSLVDQGDGQVDYVVVNGLKMDRTNNKWSDLNAQNYQPVQGENVVELFDTAGNSTVFTFILDTTAPTITLKADGVQPQNGIFRDEPSFKLHHPGLGQVDYVLINGVKKDLTNNKWSDLNGPNYAAQQGANVIEVVDTAGNRSSYTFDFDSIAPAYTVKDGLVPVNGVYNAKPSLKLSDAGLIDYVTVNGVKKDLSNNKWSDLNAQNYAAVQGSNVIEIFDVAGNVTTFAFQLDSVAPVVVSTTQVVEVRANENRTAVTLTFSEPVTGLGQGWYGDGTTFTKRYYSEKEHTVSFADAADNGGSHTFTSQNPNAVAE